MINSNLPLKKLPPFKGRLERGWSKFGVGREQRRIGTNQVFK
jgi:hypothetical protein